MSNKNISASGFGSGTPIRARLQADIPRRDGHLNAYHIQRRADGLYEVWIYRLIDHERPTEKGIHLGLYTHRAIKERRYAEHARINNINP